MAGAKRFCLQGVIAESYFVDRAAVVSVSAGAYTPDMSEMRRALATVAAAAVFAGALTGCAGYGGRLQSRSRLNGPEGEARFRRLPDENIAVALSVKHLTDPGKLDPPAWTYVAWVRGGAEEPALNLGTLRVGNDHRGGLEAVTPLRRFKLFITAEPDGTVERPTGEPLLWTSRYE